MSYVSMDAIYDSAFEEAQSIQREEGKKAKKERDEKQRRLNEIARQRTAIAQAQVQRRKELEAQQAAAIAASQKRVASLKKQQATRLAQMKAQRKQNLASAKASQRAAIRQTKFAEDQSALAIRKEAESLATGGAVSASLGVLANAGGRQGKTATQSLPSRRGGGARRTQSSLTIGSTAVGSGSGSNLSI